VRQAAVRVVWAAVKSSTDDELVDELIFSKEFWIACPDWRTDIREVSPST